MQFLSDNDSSLPKIKLEVIHEVTHGGVAALELVRKVGKTSLSRKSHNKIVCS